MKEGQQVYTAVALSGLSIGAKGLYAVFVTIADDNGVCFPTLSKLQRLVRISRNTLLGYMGELENDGIIKVVRVNGRHNAYIIKRPRSENEPVSENELAS